MSFACPHCRASVPDASIDRERDIATCAACKRVIDLRAQDLPRVDPAAVASPAPRLRDPVALPANMQIEAEGPRDGDYRAASSTASVTITRRWLRGKHYVLLLVLLAMSGGVAYGGMQYGLSLPIVFGTSVVIFWTHMLLSMFLNRTVIRAGGGRIEVTHGPIPSLVYRNMSVSAAEVRQLYVERHGAVFAVSAQLADGTAKKVVWPLVTAEQAIFVEQQLERVLGLVDFEVPGELGASYPAAVAGPGAKAGNGGAALAMLGPLIAVGAIGLFFFMSSTTLEGSLTAGGELGSGVFTPDDCSSGQRAGFVGVELSSSAAPGRRIRLVRDAVRGNLVLVEDAGQSRPTVIDADACRRFDLTVTQTSTNINDIWVIEGSATLDCDLLSGRVTFDGCH